MRVRAVGVWVVVASACLAWAAGAGKVESIGPLTDAKASDAIRKILEPKGYRITQYDGRISCELWMPENVPTQAANEVEGALFPQLRESTLLGAISVTQAFTDYKGQSIKPGLYTMRYALLPNDGNHIGVAPSRDFVLLVPVAADNDPHAIFSVSELVKLSRQASATNHPAPLNLVQLERSTLPSLSSDFEGHVILAVKLKTSGGDLPIGFVVKGGGE